MAKGRRVLKDGSREEKILEALAVAAYLEGLATEPGRLPPRLRKSWWSGQLGWAYACSCRDAAELGSPEGQYAYGKLYMRGHVVPQSYMTGLQWLSRAGAQGHREAASFLAEHYHFREALDRRRWRRTESSRGSRHPHLGVRYPEFEGVERDYKYAAHWYRIAADQGDALAARRLGRLLETGKGGVRKDVLEAMTLYARAVAAGDEAAVVRMARLNSAGNRARRR